MYVINNTPFSHDRYQRPERIRYKQLLSFRFMDNWSKYNRWKYQIIFQLQKDEFLKIYEMSNGRNTEVFFSVHFFLTLSRISNFYISIVFFQRQSLLCLQKILRMGLKREVTREDLLIFCRDSKYLFKLEKYNYRCYCERDKEAIIFLCSWNLANNYTC